MLFTMKDDEPADGPALYRWVSAWIKDLEEIDPDRDYDALNVHSFRHCFIASALHWRNIGGSLEVHWRILPCRHIARTN